MALEATHENNDCFPAQPVSRPAGVASNTYNLSCILYGRTGALLDHATHHSGSPQRFAGHVLCPHSTGKPAGWGTASTVGTTETVTQNCQSIITARGARSNRPVDG